MRPTKALNYVSCWHLTLCARQLNWNLYLNFWKQTMLPSISCIVNNLVESTQSNWDIHGNWSVKCACLNWWPNQCPLFDLCLNSCRGSRHSCQVWHKCDIEGSAFSGSVTQSPLSCFHPRNSLMACCASAMPRLLCEHHNGLMGSQNW